jgi:hypothetical protein
MNVMWDGNLLSPTPPFIYSPITSASNSAQIDAYFNEIIFFSFDLNTSSLLNFGTYKYFTSSYTSNLDNTYNFYLLPYTGAINTYLVNIDFRFGFGSITLVNTNTNSGDVVYNPKISTSSMTSRPNPIFQKLIDKVRLHKIK